MRPIPFELDVPAYRPCPSWDFYRAYRAQILAMRALVHPALAPSNAAFSGFLMMIMKGVAADLVTHDRPGTASVSR